MRIDWHKFISVDPEVHHGEPCIKGTRVPVSSNAPGVVYNDLFIVGCKVPDELPSTPGDIRAFNINTGKLEWTFHVIPKPGEFGADTWSADARQRNGGANCWLAWRWTKNVALSSFRRHHLPSIFMERIVPVKIFSRTVCWHWMRRQANASGIFKQPTMTSGIATTARHLILLPSNATEKMLTP